MNLRSNRILLGIILLVIGIFSLVQKFIGLDYGSVMLPLAGLGFLLMYKTKHKIWALAVGCYVTYFGIVGLANSLGFGDILQDTFGAMLFVIPGIIFLFIYHDRNKRGLLLPASLFIWMGVFVFLGEVSLFKSLHLPLFFVCLGMGFLMAYFIGLDFISRSIFYLAIGIIVCGLFFFNGFVSQLLLAHNLGGITSWFIIVLALAVIFSAFKKK